MCSLPREWSEQDSRGALYGCSRPTSPFSLSDEPHIVDGGCGEWGLGSRETIVQPAENGFKYVQQLKAGGANTCLLASECHREGSLFSIHSAPPVPLGTLTSSPKRPVSLAIDPKTLLSAIPISTTPIKNQSETLNGTIPTTTTASEIDDEDNENLWTVSSLTARPLIAKSRELRNNRLANKDKQKEKKKMKLLKRSIEDSQSDRISDSLDGGYGWLVVFGAFSVQFWVAGLVKSYGVLYVEIMETFPSTSAALASWIPAILSALCLVLAPLSSALCQRYSCRRVVFIGGLFCALGLTLSYFATSLVHLLFTFGVLTGIGGGLSTTPGIIIISQYFDKRRALANGICVSGTAAGSFVFPMLIERLVGSFGFHGTILILGGCMLHVCASAALYRPVNPLDDDDDKSDALKSVDTTQSLLNQNTYLSASEEPLNTCNNNKKFIENLFLEEAKNRLNDLYNSNKFVHITEKNLQENSDDEGKDFVAETIFMKPIAKSMRSSSILHSVEDLSTDSTFVYKSRNSGFDSNRGSKRRNKNQSNADEAHTNAESAANRIALAPTSPKNMASKAEHIVVVSETSNNGLAPTTTNRGLSKSMIIPTPVSDFNNEDENDNDTDEFRGQIINEGGCCHWINCYLDLSLLRDPLFILMCLSVTLMSTGCPYMLYYLPAYALTAGFTKTEAGYLVAVSAALDLCGRLGFGYLSDLQLFDRKKAYIICIFGAGLAVLTLPVAEMSSSLYSLACSVGTYGFCLGSWYLLMPVLLADIFGTDRISSSYGLIRMFQSVGAISVPPLAGYLRDLTGGYEICFYCMGACMVLGSVPLIISIIFYDKLTSSSTSDDPEVSTVS